jgi:signal transduction histidine kinase
VTVGGTVGEREVQFEITDAGPGIHASDLPHVFEPYWSGKHRKEGTGLGLYISRGIVESHGGRIWAESKLQEGTTFRFTLPLAPGEESVR